MSSDSLGSRNRETLELLVPEGGELLRRARDVAELARSLGGETASPPAADPIRARGELEVQRTLRVGIALEDLLVHHLSAEVGGRGFAWFGRARGGLQQAWRTLDEFRDELRELPGVPAPGETPLAVAGRLLEGLFRLGWEAHRLELWRARLEHAAGGAERGEAAFRERLDDEEESGAAERVRAELVAGWVESLLDRGAVRDAQVVLEEHTLSALRRDRRLVQLSIWTRLLTGDLEGALRLAAKGSPWDGTLPDALVELRGRWPEALPALGGVAAPSFAAVPSLPGDESPQRSRRPLGASAFGVFAFGPGRQVEPLLLDVAPALRSRVRGWLFEREDACCVPSQPEHRLVIEAAPCHAHGPRPMGALGEEALALAHAPVLDDEGEVAGWLHVECEHHLLPAQARLAELARGWRLPLIRRGRRAEVIAVRRADSVFEARPECSRWGQHDARSRLEATTPEQGREMATEVFAGLARALGLDTAQRAWWGFVVERGELRFAGGGGEGLGDAKRDPGGARALDRCLATRGAVSFEEPDRRLSIHAEAASGLVLPLDTGGELVGVLAIESRRRRSFPPGRLDQHLETAAAFTLPLSLAGFRAWHLERFGFDLFFDTTSPEFRAYAEQLERVARSPSPVVLSGPPGSGRMVFARWIHWLGGRARASLEVLGGVTDDDAGRAPRRTLREALRERRGGSLILPEVGSLSAAGQVDLLHHLEGFDRGERRSGRDSSGEPRLIATSSRALGRSGEEEELRADLAARLDRLQVFVPPLRDRRGEIPTLARFLAARFAREEGCRPPRFTEAATALLWRQSWAGNLRELESLVFKLVLLFPDEELGAEQIDEVARRFRFVLEPKIPTRRPRRADLVAALRTTLIKAGTRFNKRRAAMYLGWDTDTLVARLEEASIDEETIRDEPRAWGM